MSKRTHTHTQTEQLRAVKSNNENKTKQTKKSLPYGLLIAHSYTEGA